MQAPSRKSKTIFFVVALVWCALCLVDLFSPNAPAPNSSDYVSLRTILIALSVYSLGLATLFWVFRNWIIKRLHKHRFLLSPHATFRLLMYTVLIFPAVCGNLLYGVGMPLSQYLVFLGTSIIGVLAWGIYDLRTDSITGHEPA